MSVLVDTKKRQALIMGLRNQSSRAVNPSKNKVQGSQAEVRDLLVIAD